MIRTIMALATIAVLVGCTPAPRFTGTESSSPKREFERPPERQEPRADSTVTNDMIRLGWILQSYLGKPYKGSSSFEAGMDCSEFTRDVFRQYLHTDIPRTSQDQYSIGHEVPRAKLRFGDLVFFRTDGKQVSHVGIWVGYDEFIHASSSEGIIITSLEDGYWRKRYVGARRILE